MAADFLFVASKDAMEILSDNLVLDAEFLLEQHQDQMKVLMTALQKDRVMAETGFLAELVVGDKEMGNRLETMCDLGTWLLALPW